MHNLAQSAAARRRSGKAAGGEPSASSAPIKSRAGKPQGKTGSIAVSDPRAGNEDGELETPHPFRAVGGGEGGDGDQLLAPSSSKAAPSPQVLALEAQIQAQSENLVWFKSLSAPRSHAQSAHSGGEAAIGSDNENVQHEDAGSARSGDQHPSLHFEDVKLNAPTPEFVSALEMRIKDLKEKLAVQLQVEERDRLGQIQRASDLAAARLKLHQREAALILADQQRVQARAQQFNPQSQSAHQNAQRALEIQAQGVQDLADFEDPEQKRVRAQVNKAQTLLKSKPVTVSAADLSLRKIGNFGRKSKAREAVLAQGGFYSKSETRQIRDADDINPFSDRSSDSQPLQKDHNGMHLDDFCVPDELISQSSETASTEASDATRSEPDSDEEEEAAEIRVEIASRWMEHFSKIGFFPAPSAERLLELRSVEICIKRQTSRSWIMELILNKWLNQDLNLLKMKDVVEFMRQMSLLPGEFAFDLYKICYIHFQELCPTFYKFLYKLMKTYIPAHNEIFARALIAAKSKKAKSMPEPLVSAAAIADDADFKRKPKPVTKQPEIKNIKDIAYITGTFYNNWRHYSIDHHDCGYEFKSIWECLHPDQRTTLANLAILPEKTVKLMTTEEILDLFRRLFGHKSSAACLKAAAAVHFEGDSLSKSAWADQYQLFIDVMNQTPKKEWPPEKELAKKFIQSCPMQYLKSDVLAREPADLKTALELVMVNLDHPGFMASALAQPSGRERDKPHDSKHQPAPAAPKKTFGAATDARGPRAISTAAGATAAGAVAVPKKPVTLCARCQKPGHSAEVCISKHDAKGDRLERQDDEVYKKKKEAYFAMKKQAIAVVATDETDETSSESHDTDDDEACGVFMILSDDSEASDSASIDCPPSPRLVCVESNPGPGPANSFNQYSQLSEENACTARGETKRRIHAIISAQLAAIDADSDFSYPDWPISMHADDGAQFIPVANGNVARCQLVNKTDSTARFIVNGQPLTVTSFIDDPSVVVFTGATPPEPQLEGEGLNPDPATATPADDTCGTPGHVCSRRCLAGIDLVAHIQQTYDYLSCARTVAEMREMQSLSAASVRAYDTYIAARALPAPPLVGVELNPGPASVFTSTSAFENAMKYMQNSHGKAKIKLIKKSKMMLKFLVNGEEVTLVLNAGFQFVPAPLLVGIEANPGPNSPTFPLHEDFHTWPKTQQDEFVGLMTYICNAYGTMVPWNHPTSISDSDDSDSSPEVPPSPRLVNVEPNPGPKLKKPPPSERIVLKKPTLGAFIFEQTAEVEPPALPALNETEDFSHIVHLLPEVPDVLPDLQFPVPELHPPKLLVQNMTAVQPVKSEVICEPTPLPIIASPHVGTTFKNHGAAIIEDDFTMRDFDIELPASLCNGVNSDSSVTSCSSITSDEESEDDLPICTVQDDADLLHPPRFNAFIKAIGTAVTPSPANLVVTAIDTMCLGHSVISQQLVSQLNLTTKPYERQSRTATGAKVKCSHMAMFTVTVYVRDIWVSYDAEAMVWEKTAVPLLLSNKFGLTTGLVDFVQPNSERVQYFGRAAFSSNWESLIANAELVAAAHYAEDVIPEELEDLCDLSAALKWGQQNISSLPADALRYAKLFPSLLLPIPKDADPRLKKWRAHIIEANIPSYAWPACDVKDLKEARLPYKAIPLVHIELDKLAEQHYVENCPEMPSGVCMRIQLVNKTKTTKRFTINGSVQKKVSQIGVYPMPNMRTIFQFVAGFEWRMKLDLRNGYYNFEVHVDDRKWTYTIGAGRCVQWRKLPQGVATACGFFQYAMEALLGPEIVMVIAAIYLDDLIVVGHTQEECEANFVKILRIFVDHNIRVSFEKSTFTPSRNISFLGCRLEGNTVHPGPKVATMLAKIKPPHHQLTEKAQRHHLHVFLGACAFIMAHIPGLKQALHLLYQSVASEPFNYGQPEIAAFEICFAMTMKLEPYHLPSQEPGYVTEIQSDASGGQQTPEDPGNWAAALGQRKNCGQPKGAEGFELLQLAGGTFNSRQCAWSTLQKEGKAVFEAFVNFDVYVRGTHIYLIVDSRVLFWMFRTKDPMVARWYSFIQSFDFEMVHFSSEENALCDALTRCVSVTPLRVPEPRLKPKGTSTPPAPRLVCVESNPGPIRQYPVEEFAVFAALNNMASFIDDSDVVVLTDDLLLFLLGPARPTSYTVGGWHSICDSISFKIGKWQKDRQLFWERSTPPAARLVGIELNPGPIENGGNANDHFPTSSSSDDPDPVVISSDTSGEDLVAPVSTRKRQNDRHTPPGSQQPPAAGGHASPTSARPAHSAAGGQAAPLSERPAARRTARSRSTQDDGRSAPRPDDQDEVERQVPPVRSSESPVERLRARAQDAPQPAPAVELPPVPRVAPLMPLPRMPPIPPHSDDTPVVVRNMLIAHHVERTAENFFSALSQGLAHHDFVAGGPALVYSTHPSYRPADVRESVCKFMLDNAHEPLDILNGLTISESFRQDYVDTADAMLEFDDLDEGYTPRSFREYMHFMLSPNTYADKLTVHCASVCFRASLVLIELQTGLCTYSSPASPLKRVLFPFDRQTHRFNWAHRQNEPCRLQEDCDEFVPFLARYNEFPIRPRIAAFGPEPPPPNSMDNSIPASSRHLQWIQEAHCGFTGHPGLSATIQILKDQNREWRGMTAQTAQFIKQCPTCILSRMRHNPALHSTSTIRVSAHPLRRWHIDQSGNMLRCQHTGFNRMIVFIDEATGFCVVRGSRDGCALELAVAFIDVMGFFGLPDSIHSDNGPENDAYLWDQICRLTGMKHTLSLPSLPNTNGIVERCIQTCKRFLRQLCTDMGKFNAWGLMLGIVQHAVNALPRSAIGCSPSQLVLGSFYNPDHFVIPSFYMKRGIREGDIVDANFYDIAGNFAHRMMYMQQLITNHYHEHLETLFDAARRRDYVEIEDIVVGSFVLIDWPSTKPSPLCPNMRGPYIVTSKRRNVIHLVSASTPPPAHQPQSLTWSMHAKVYPLDAPLERNVDDPAATQLSSANPSLAVDCIISHDFDHDTPHPADRFEVRNQRYQVRFWGPPPLVGPAETRYRHQLFTLRYDAIYNTLAFDTYAINNPQLTGHHSVLRMPANWDPHSVSKTKRPMHEVYLDAERYLGSDSDPG